MMIKKGQFQAQQLDCMKFRNTSLGNRVIELMNNFADFRNGKKVRFGGEIGFFFFFLLTKYLGPQLIKKASRLIKVVYHCKVLPKFIKSAMCTEVRNSFTKKGALDFAKSIGRSYNLAIFQLLFIFSSVCNSKLRLDFYL